MKNLVIAIIVLALSVPVFSACDGSGKPADRPADGWERIEYWHIEFDVMTSWEELNSENSKRYSLGPDAGELWVHCTSGSSFGYDEPVELAEYVQDYISSYIAYPESEGMEYEQISAKETVVNELPCYELEYNYKGGEPESIYNKELFVEKDSEGMGYFVILFRFVQADDANIYDHVINSIH